MILKLPYSHPILSADSASQVSALWTKEVPLVIDGPPLRPPRRGSLEKGRGRCRRPTAPSSPWAKPAATSAHDSAKRGADNGGWSRDRAEGCRPTPLARRARFAAPPRGTAKFQPVSEILQICGGCRHVRSRIPMRNTQARGRAPNSPANPLPTGSYSAAAKPSQITSKSLTCSSFLSPSRGILGAESVFFPAGREMRQGHPSPDTRCASSAYRRPTQNLRVRNRPTEADGNFCSEALPDYSGIRAKPVKQRAGG